LPPERRASESPIAIACLRLVTFLPERPERSSPRFISCMLRLTLREAFGPYFRFLRPPLDLRELFRDDFLRPPDFLCEELLRLLELRFRRLEDFLRLDFFLGIVFLRFPPDE